ncbi:MAG: ABC transporter ATP-binding protein [Candidatus Glassbacteria bacterium]|nr:ABC transporter ATP-binding protein [Candidatus Glassbacteria bacterium]
MSYPVQVAGLQKSFGNLKAVDDFSLELGQGELFGLIGPDGAGKTTLIRILVGLMLADGGSASVGGFDVVRERARVKEIIGYMPQRFSLYPDLTLEENLRFYADLFQVPEAERRARQQRLMQFSRLEPFLGRRAGQLSGGMKQKLALSCTLIHQPEILFLDEPTTGVDPLSRREFWSLLDSLQAEGKTIVVSTAYMDEAVRCDRVGLMFTGRLMAVDTPERLRKTYPFDLLEVELDEPVLNLQLIKGLPRVRSVQVFGDRLHVGVAEAQAAAASLERELSQRAVGPVRVRRIEPCLEDVFVELIGSWKERISRDPDKRGE